MNFAYCGLCFWVLYFILVPVAFLHMWIVCLYDLLLWDSWHCWYMILSYGHVVQFLFWYSETWIYIPQIMHVFISPTKTPICEKIYFPGLNICTFYQIPKLWLKTKHKVAICCNLCIRYWKKGKKQISSYNFLFPLLSSYGLIILWVQNHTNKAELYSYHWQDYVVLIKFCSQLLHVSF